MSLLLSLCSDENLLVLTFLHHHKLPCRVSFPWEKKTLHVRDPQDPPNWGALRVPDHFRLEFMAGDPPPPELQLVRLCFFLVIRVLLHLPNIHYLSVMLRNFFSQQKYQYRKMRHWLNNFPCNNIWEDGAAKLFLTDLLNLLFIKEDYTM